MVQEALLRLHRAEARRAPEGVRGHGHDAAGDRPAALRPRAAGDLRRARGCRSRWSPTRGRTTSRSRWRCWSRWRASRPSSGRSSCSTTSSTTATTRSRRSSARARENCRQLALRARRHVEARRPRFEPSRERARGAGRPVLRGRSRDGDLDGLVALLAEDAVMTGDGGGKAAARATPLDGGEKVARFLLGLDAPRRARRPTRSSPREVNGQPGALVREDGGVVTRDERSTSSDGRVAAIRSRRQPRQAPPPAGGSDPAVRSGRRDRPG